MSEYLGDCITLKQKVIHILTDLHLLAKIGTINPTPLVSAARRLEVAKIRAARLAAKNFLNITLAPS